MKAFFLLLSCSWSAHARSGVAHHAVVNDELVELGDALAEDVAVLEAKLEEAYDDTVGQIGVEMELHNMQTPEDWSGITYDTVLARSSKALCTSGIPLLQLKGEANRFVEVVFGPVSISDNPKEDRCSTANLAKMMVRVRQLQGDGTITNRKGQEFTTVAQIMNHITRDVVSSTVSSKSSKKKDWIGMQYPVGSPSGAKVSSNGKPKANMFENVPLFGMKKEVVNIQVNHMAKLSMWGTGILVDSAAEHLRKKALQQLEKSLHEGNFGLGAKEPPTECEGQWNNEPCKSFNVLHNYLCSHAYRWVVAKVSSQELRVDRLGSEPMDSQSLASQGAMSGFTVVKEGIPVLPKMGNVDDMYTKYVPFYKVDYTNGCKPNLYGSQYVRERATLMPKAQEERDRKATELCKQFGASPDACEQPHWVFEKPSTAIRSICLSGLWLEKTTDRADVCASYPKTIGKTKEVNLQLEPACYPAFYPENNPDWAQKNSKRIDTINEQYGERYMLHDKCVEWAIPFMQREFKSIMPRAKEAKCDGQGYRQAKCTEGIPPEADMRGYLEDAFKGSLLSWVAGYNDVMINPQHAWTKDLPEDDTKWWANTAKVNPPYKEDEGRVLIEYRRTKSFQPDKEPPSKTDKPTKNLLLKPTTNVMESKANLEFIENGLNYILKSDA